MDCKSALPLVRKHTDGMIHAVHMRDEVDQLERSAAALRLYWQQCFALGCESSTDDPTTTFSLLRQAGLDAERAMFRATGGVNTHKGAIFTLGVICGAIGRLWSADALRDPDGADAPCRDLNTILNESAAIVREAVEADFAMLSAHPETARTAGQRLYLDYGLRGIRGEVADGLPGVARVSLPLFRRLLAAGCSRNDAGSVALLALIARGGVKAAEKAANAASWLFDAEPVPSTEAILRLDRAFIRQLWIGIP